MRKMKQNNFKEGWDCSSSCSLVNANCATPKLLWFLVFSSLHPSTLVQGRYRDSVTLKDNALVVQS